MGSGGCRWPNLLANDTRARAAPSTHATHKPACTTGRRRRRWVFRQPRPRAPRALVPAGGVQPILQVSPRVVRAGPSMRQRAHPAAARGELGNLLPPPRPPDPALPQSLSERMPTSRPSAASRGCLGMKTPHASVKPSRHGTPRQRTGGEGRCWIPGNDRLPGGGKHPCGKKIAQGPGSSDKLHCRPRAACSARLSHSIPHPRGRSWHPISTLPATRSFPPPLLATHLQVPPAAPAVHPVFPRKCHGPAHSQAAVVGVSWGGRAVRRAGSVHVRSRPAGCTGAAPGRAGRGGEPARGRRLVRRRLGSALRRRPAGAEAPGAGHQPGHPGPDLCSGRACSHAQGEVRHPQGFIAWKLWRVCWGREEGASE